MTHTEFLLARRAYLGGSDMAKIIGASPYGGPYDVYLSKRGQDTFTGNAATRAGQYFEPGVAQWYADQTGHELQKVEHLRHPEHEFLGGNPDFLVVDDPNLGLEIKTSSEEMLRQVDEEGELVWGPSGTDQVPMDYLVQCTWYMGLTGRRRWDLAVFFFGSRREFRLYHLTFDRDLYDMLVERGVAFWNAHIAADVPPAMDLIPSDLVAAHLMRQAQAAGKIVEATQDLQALSMSLEDVSLRRKALEEQEDAIKARLMEAMVPLGAQKIQGKTDGAKWSVAIEGGGEGKPVTDFRGIALQLAKRAGLPGIPPELEADFTRPGTPKSPYIRGYFNSVRASRAKATSNQNIA